MNLNFFKKKVLSVEIREKIASLLCEGVIISEKDLSTYKKIFSDVDSEETIKKELAGFDAYMILVSVSSFYKNGREGPKLFSSFLNIYEDSLVRAQVFESKSICDKFIEERVKEYSTISQDKRETNYLIPLSISITKNFGSKNISSSIAMASMFVNLSKANMEFLDDVNKRIG